MPGNRVALADLRGQGFIMREQASAKRPTAEACSGGKVSRAQDRDGTGKQRDGETDVAAGLRLGMISKFGVVPDVEGGAVVVPSVEGWRREQPLTVFYPDYKHLLAAQLEFLRCLQDERPLPDVPRAF